VDTSSTGILDPEATLYLFTYVSAADDGAKLNASLPFSTKKRIGRKPLAWFRFDETKKHASLMLADQTITSTATSYQAIFGNIELKEGIWEWEISLLTMYTHTYSVCVGVSPTTFTAFNNSQMVGYPGHIPGWAFAAGSAQAYGDGTQVSYGQPAKTGDVIRLRLDLETKPGTLEFFLNGKSLGIAFKAIRGPVRPALSLYGPSTVQLQFPK